MLTRERALEAIESLDQPGADVTLHDVFGALPYPESEVAAVVNDLLERGACAGKPNRGDNQLLAAHNLRLTPLGTDMMQRARGPRLERSQESLLMTIVEAARNVSPSQRTPFIVEGRFASAQEDISHLGLQDGLRAPLVDLEILAEAGLIRLRQERAGHSFDVTPDGFEHYDRLHHRSQNGVVEVDAAVRRYLDAEPFRTAHPDPFRLWSQAAEMLWAAGSESAYTTIGHLCRESMQAFAADLVARHEEAPASADPAKTVDRIRAVLALRKEQLGSTVGPFLDALLIYWGTVSDLVQRQEHGAQREGEPLVWADARRVVFQTAIVMFEISSACSG